MHHNRLFVSTPEFPRPVPPPPFSHGSATTPRLLLRGKTARLAQPRERFDVPAEAVATTATSTDAQQRTSARYRLDIGGTTAVPPPSLSHTASSPRSSHQLPFHTTRIIKSSAKYAKIREAKKSEKEQQAAALAANQTTATKRRVSPLRSSSPTPNFAREADWFSKLLKNPTSVSYESQQRAFAGPRILAEKQLYRSTLLNNQRPRSAAFSAKIAAAANDVVNHPSFAATAANDEHLDFLQHRSLSRCGGDAASRASSPGSEEMKRNEWQRQHLQQPSFTGKEATTSLVIAAGVEHSNSPVRARPVSATIQQQQQQYQVPSSTAITVPRETTTATSPRDPRLSTSRALMQAALQQEQRDKYNGRQIFSRLSFSAAPQHPPALHRHVSPRLSTPPTFMVAVDTSGGQIVAEALTCSGSQLQTPAKPFRPHSAGPNPRFAAKIEQERIEVVRLREQKAAEIHAKQAAEEERRARVPGPPSRTLQMSHVVAVPGVFAAGLKSTKSAELAAVCLAETSASHPLSIAPVGSGFVPVPVEFSPPPVMNRK